MKARYHLSPDDYVAYNQRICLRRIWRLLAVMLLLVGAIITALDGLSGLLSFLIGSVGGLAVLALFIYVLVPRSARAIYMEQPSMSEVRELTIDAQGAEFTQPSGSFRTDWTSIVQWDETPRLLALFINRATFIPITKADIGAQMTDEIRTLLARSGLPAPLRRRRRA